MNQQQFSMLNPGFSAESANSDPRSEPGYLIDSSYGNEHDIKESHQIKTMISKYFDHANKQQQKEMIILRIQEIVDQWMFNINVNERKIPENVAHMQLARVLPFGSYYLGVSSVDGDIDLVCIAPNFVERQNHFNLQLFSMISSMKGVTYHNNVSDAKVPILQFEIEGIPVDLSFAQLDVETLPEDIDQEIPDKHLLNMEDRDKMSINGYRCNQAIMRHVTENHSNEADKARSKLRFQDALKVIKIWARSNGIYENRLGFLGGISWALLLAKICQMFPNAEVNVLLEQFFVQYSTWKWSIMDVQLAPFDQAEDRTKAIKSEMYIYTPAYPEYNSTERVKRINLDIIERKLKEAAVLVQEEIKTGKKPWDKLIEEENYLDEFKQFIEIDLIRTKFDETMREFKTQQDKLSVKLLTLFDIFSHKKPTSLEIRPWPVFFKKRDTKYPQCSAFLIGIKAKKPITEHFSFKNCIVEFASQQQKALDNLTNCMIRVFQTTRAELTDIIFDETQEGEQDYYEYDFTANNNNQDGSGEDSNGLNQKRTNGQDILAAAAAAGIAGAQPYKRQRLDSNEKLDKNSTHKNSNGDDQKEEEQQGQQSEENEDNLDDYL